MRSLFMWRSLEQRLPEVGFSVTWKKRRPYFNVRDLFDKVILSVGHENIWKGGES